MDYTKQLEKSNTLSTFNILNGIRITNMGPDSGEAVVDVGPNTLNMAGNLHGGLLYAVCDAAASTAARSLGIRHFTLNSSFNFIRSVNSGLVTARAYVDHRGRTSCVIRAEARSEAGKLIAEGIFTFFNMGVPTATLPD